MRQNTDNSAYYPEQQNSINFKKHFYRIIRKWHWFTISISLGLIIALLCNQYMPLVYSIHSSMVVNEYESGIKQLSLSQTNTNNERNVNILGQDHVGRLKSHILTLNALQSLGWNISWYKKTPFYGKDLYGNEPYKVILLPEKSNLTDIPLIIIQLSDNEYQLEAKTIMFTDRGKFGEPFINNYFSFVIQKTRNSIQDKELYFVINNLNKLAIDYQKKLDIISNEKKPDMLELILSDKNAQRGVDFLNRLEKTYIEYGLAEKNRVAINTIKFIDNQLKGVIDSLSDSESRFTDFRTRTKSVDLNQESGIVMQKKESLESEKALLENRLEYLRKLRDILNDSKQMKQVVVPSVYGITDQTLNALVSKLSDLYTNREKLSFSVQAKAPSLIMLDNEIQLTHNMLVQNINAILKTTESELENLLKRESGFSTQLSLLPRTEQQLKSLQRTSELNNELYNYLMKMRAESAITYASNQPDVKVLDAARIETAKQTSPKNIINYVVGTILGFLFPFGIILLSDFINDTVHSKEEVEEKTNLPVAGMVIHNKSKKDLVVLENPKSSISESFRLLRTNLKFMLNGHGKRVIAIQSTVAGEGKSFVSLNLASILALNNNKVLLVAVDMRMSNLNKVLKTSNEKGISTYLSKQDSFEDIIEATPINNLSYIPSGPVPPNPAELLENGRFEKFIEEAKLKFDYIILDSPPVSLVTDGIITGRHADVNLYVIRFRYSRGGHLKFLSELEMKKTLPNLALVLNDATNENSPIGSYYNSRNKGYYLE